MELNRIKSHMQQMNTAMQNSPITIHSGANVKPTRDELRAREILKRSCASIIINADDWGRDSATTDRTLDCFLRGTISSVSAMVFMCDSERAADLAQQHDIDAGLHLNFTLPYSGARCPARLIQHQEKISRALNAHRFAPVLYHLGLADSFEYVVKAEMEEYERLYDSVARRVDGHHHMHLCANMLSQYLLPWGIIVRRNLTFGPGEKGYFNRLYRRRQDQRLARRHKLADLFFDLQPLEPRDRLKRIFGMADRFDIEIETHPIRDDEYKFLTSAEITHCAGLIKVARGYTLPSRGQISSVRRLL